jgi:hypothetical protein
MFCEILLLCCLSELGKAVLLKSVKAGAEMVIILRNVHISMKNEAATGEVLVLESRSVEWRWFFDTDIDGWESSKRRK